MLTSATRQLHANIGALGEKTQRDIIRHNKAQLHFTELCASAGDHEVKVAWCRPSDVAILMLHPVSTRTSCHSNCSSCKEPKAKRHTSKPPHFAKRQPTQNQQKLTCTTQGGREEKGARAPRNGERLGQGLEWQFMCESSSAD